MLQIFLDALTEAVKMVPLLLIIYIGIELIEYKFGNVIKTKIKKAGAVGPIVGAIAGSFPQCGFSVVATALYTQRLVTIGTLLAVYLSTSDEAIPIILSQPDKAAVIFPLILTKIFIALIAGYAIDFVFRKKNKKVLQHIKAYSDGNDDKGHDHNSVMDEQACCGHSLDSGAKMFSWKEIFFHPIVHTAKIFIFILSISFLINFAIFEVGAESFGKFLLGHGFFQIFLATVIGIIPNCSASVAITEFYLRGLISYGSVVAGLCASGGLGILVLLREEKDKKNVFVILSLLFGVSVLAGLIIQYVF